MKRQVKPKSSSGIKRIYPLFFWHECDECRQEFREEYGWKRVISPAFGGLVPIGLINRKKCICGACAPTLKDAKRIFEEPPKPLPMPPVKPPKPEGPPLVDVMDIELYD